MGNWVSRQKSLCGIITLLFVAIPQWWSACWSLFSSTPFFQWLKSKGITTSQIHFSPYWITTTIGLILLYLIWKSDNKPESVRFNALWDSQFQPHCLKCNTKLNSDGFDSLTCLTCGTTTTLTAGERSNGQLVSITLGKAQEILSEEKFKKRESHEQIP